MRKFIDLHADATGGGSNLLLFSVLYILLVKVILRIQVLICKDTPFFPYEEMIDKIIFFVSGCQNVRKSFCHFSCCRGGY